MVFCRKSFLVWIISSIYSKSNGGNKSPQRIFFFPKQRIFTYRETFFLLKKRDIFFRSVFLFKVYYSQNKLLQESFFYNFSWLGHFYYISLHLSILLFPFLPTLKLTDQLWNGKRRQSMNLVAIQVKKKKVNNVNVELYYDTWNPIFFLKAPPTLKSIIHHLFCPQQRFLIFSTQTYSSWQYQLSC